MSAWPTGWHRDPSLMQAAVETYGDPSKAARVIGHPAERTARAAWTMMNDRPARYARSSAPIPVAAAAPAEPAEIIALRRQIEVLRGTNKALRDQVDTGILNANVIDAVRELMAPVLKSYPVLLEQVSCVEIPRLPKHSEPIEIIVYLADWHIGEVISPEDVEGHNAYGPQIAAERVEHIAVVLAEFVEFYAAAHPVKRITFALAGDMVNNAGVLHPTQTTDYARVLVQALDASLLAAQLIAPFSKIEGTEVRVIATAGGNHGRSNTGKPPFGPAAAQTSWDQVMYEHLAAMLWGHGIDFQLGRAYSITVDVAGHAVWLAHGHAIKGGGGALGIPAYGTKRASTSAVMASVLEAIRSANPGRIVKHARVAHFHQEVQMPMPTGTFKICPSIKGTGPWELAALGAVSSPECLFEVFHPEHGIIGSHTIDCSRPRGEGFTWGAMRSSAPTIALFEDGSARP